MTYKLKDDVTVQDLVDFGIYMQVASWFVWKKRRPFGTEPEITESALVGMYKFVDPSGRRWMLKGEWVEAEETRVAADDTDATAWM